jgi:hypothetical protein
VRKSHTVDIFNYECNRSNNSKNAIKFLIQKVYSVEVISPTTLAVSLARITTRQDIGFGKAPKLTNIARMHRTQAGDTLKKFACRFTFFIRPNRFNPRRLHAKVASPTAGKK